jgi:hypothetical protein
LILATIEFYRLSRKMTAHLTNDGWTVSELTALGGNLTLLFNPSEHGTADRGSVRRAALEAADALNGRVTFLRDPPPRWGQPRSRP